MAKGTAISFVTWPDGRVAGKSVGIYGEVRAREMFVASYLPEEWFGHVKIGYVAQTLWDGAREKGFRSHTIEIGADGLPKLAAQLPPP